MTYEEGAGFLVSSMTAYHGLVQLSNTRRGERVLVHAAAGGVGTATVQLAKYLGAQVFATAGTSEKISVARAQGADYAINYRSTDFAKEIQRITDSYGVDVVMDSVGGGVFGKSWSLLAEMGRYVLFGLSSLSGKGGLNPLKTAMTFARMVPIVPAALISSNKALLGFNLGTLKSKVEYFQESGGELIRLQAKGVLRPVIGKVFHFRDIVAAHHALQTRQTIGKVIVVVD
jgi:NADPH2:quinone reductase